MANTIISDLHRHPGTIYFGHEGRADVIIYDDPELPPEGLCTFELPNSASDWLRIPPTHILDRRYPHVCFECKKLLKFEELFLANMGTGGPVMYANFDMPLYRRLKKLWRSRDVQFFCCNCFKVQISF